MTPPEDDDYETSSQKEFNKFLLGRENLTAAEKMDIKRTRAESKLADMLREKNLVRDKAKETEE